MKIKSGLFKSLTAVIMTLLMMIPQCFTTSAYAEESNSKDSSSKEVILFKGEKHATGSWDPWETLVDINDMNVKDFVQPFNIEIEYEGDYAPYVIFQSWTGGETWGQVQPSFTSKGVAYYDYDACKEGYKSSDFSTLSNISIKPGGADVTITSVKLVPRSAETAINYEGKAGKIVNNINVGWNLGNTLDSWSDWVEKQTAGTPTNYETSWGNPATTKEMIHKVKEAGFNAIRVPITWKQHIDDKNGYAVDKAWMDRVQEVVDYVMDEGMYCIINVHHDTGDQGWLRASDESVKNNGEKFKALWTQISDRFKDYNDDLLFEGFNEILNESNNWQYPGKEATGAVNTLNQMFVDTVRASGGNNDKRCLVVNTYAANTDGTVLDEFVLPKDTVENSLIVQIHAYLPYTYASTISETTKQDKWKDNRGKAVIDGMMLNIYHHFTSKNIPVIMGEIAAANKDNTADRADYAGYIANNSKKYGMKCFWWDNGGYFEKDKTYGYEIGCALLNRHTMEWVYPEIVKAFTGVDPDKKELGSGDVNDDGTVNIVDFIYLRKYLANKYNGKFNKKNADLNGDGKVDVLDLVELKKII